MTTVSVVKPVAFAHQSACLERMIARPAFALLLEAGTGKTKIIVDDAARLYKRCDIEQLIVIAPNGVHRNWISQIETWMPDDVPYVAAFWSVGLKREAKEEFEWTATTDLKGRALRILTFNIEFMSLERGFLLVEKYMKRRRSMIVIDESHKIKSPSSTRTRSCVKLGKYASFRRILSGTPTTKGYEDLWAQFKFLNPGIINCKTFAEFKSRYCRMGGFQGRSIVGYENVDELLRRIAPFSFEANKRDCLDLPPETFVTVEVELSSEQKRIYEQLRDDFMAEIAFGNVIEVPMAMTRMMRLQQIVSGFVGNMDTKEVTNLPCPRLKRVVELVEEALRGKVIVWCNFRTDVQNVVSALLAADIQSVPYYGVMNEAERFKNLTQFKTTDSVRVLVATRATGGTGHDINEADTVINYSHGYKSEERIQAHARNMRPGQTLPVTYYDMVAPGTVEVKVLEVLAARKNLADTLKNMDVYREILNTGWEF